MKNCDFEDENSPAHCEIDDLDRQILRLLRDDSRRPFLEIARELKVSGGTVHVRVAKLKEAGIIKGSRLVIDTRCLGYTVSAIVGVQLSHAKASKEVKAGLCDIPEVTEVHYTTGGFNLLVRIHATSIQDLYLLLSERVQAIEGVQSTETFIILDTHLERDLDF